MEKELLYWKHRCLLAEKYIEERLCDPDITEDEWIAYKEWLVVKQSGF